MTNHEAEGMPEADIIVNEKVNGFSD